MIVRERRYPKEEFARRGNEIYERDVKPLVEPDNKGNYVAIDIETGSWEMDSSEMEAGNRLRLRLPDAHVWLVRVGYPYVHRLAATPSLAA